MIEIAGDLLEGGGQIVRTSTALAALTAKDIKITKIRHNRPNPGLQPQHVTAISALASICNADTEGLTVGSRELLFKPRRHVAGHFNLDVGTAGSIPLMLQALMPSAAFAPSDVEFDVTGGTDVKWSPSIDYVRLVTLPVLEMMGYRATLQVHRRGHYPKGGGKVSMSIRPSRSLKSIRLTEQGHLSRVEGISHCVKLPSHVAQRQADSAKAELRVGGLVDASIAIETYPPDQDPHLGPGSGITLLMKSSTSSVLGSDSIGERGKRAERVGDEAAIRLLEAFRSKAPLDRHMGDILIPYMAVADGRSEILVAEITMHTLTNIKVAELLTGVKFEVEGDLKKPGKIAVDGINYRT